MPVPVVMVGVESVVTTAALKPVVMLMRAASVVVRVMMTVPAAVVVLVRPVFPRALLVGALVVAFGAALCVVF